MAEMLYLAGGEVGGQLTVDVERGATCGAIAAKAGGRTARLLVGAESLRQFGAVAAAMHRGMLSGEQTLTMFAEGGADPAKPTGTVSLLPQGEALRNGGTTVITVSPDGESQVQVEITHLDLMEFAQACSAASHDM